MNDIIMDDDALLHNGAGNKAVNLSKLKGAGFNVPAFFVIAVRSTNTADDFDLPTAQISAALCGLSGTAFAVRSSSTEEDAADASFAGQFESYLHVAADDVIEYVSRVAASGISEQVTTYRQSTGHHNATTIPAVIVQEMIDADVSGVAFGADPVNGDPDTRVVAATTGNADALVSGDRQGDTWRIDGQGKVTDADIEGDHPVLAKHLLHRVVRLVEQAGEFFGVPQDIEWAIQKGRLYLLQSRSITTLTEPPDSQSYALWDNSNIVESYGGVTTPLTFSVAREAYQEAYRHMGRVLGISESVIRDNQRAYEQMIGLIQGRVYYNLLNWYRLLMLTPGFRHNRRFMEQMMGVTEDLPEEATPTPPQDGPGSKIRASLSTLRVAVSLSCRMLTHGRDVRRFHDTLDESLAPVDLAVMPLTSLIDYYEQLQARVIPAWDTPLVNDLYCMIFHGALRQLAGRWLHEDLAGIHNDLVAGESAIVSLEPVRRMTAMAALARSDPSLIDCLCTGTVDEIEVRVDPKPEIRSMLDDYIAQFGDRCLDELKLESRTLRDDPMPLYRAVGHLAAHPPGPGQGDELRDAAEKKLADALQKSPVRRWILNVVLGLARGRIRDRENLRFERTRVYGRVRAIFLEIGRRLAGLGALQSAEDVFYLEAGEVAAFIRGTGTGGDIARLVSLRRHEFAGFAAGDDLPRRFITCGPPQLRSSIQTTQSTSDTSGDMRTGQACSKGVVRGPVRIVRDPRNTPFRNGEILVAERTDPGWVTIFPLVTAMIMERGSLLSHSAIVARELNIPTVVGVDDACQWLSDGDWVELDGATGVVRKLDQEELAA